MKIERVKQNIETVEINYTKYLLYFLGSLLDTVSSAIYTNEETKVQNAFKITTQTFPVQLEILKKH